MNEMIIQITSAGTMSHNGSFHTVYLHALTSEGRLLLNTLDGQGVWIDITPDLDTIARKSNNQ